MHPINPAQVLWVPGVIGGLAALVIPLIGGPLSDRCTAKMGRRKPFLIYGSVASCLCLLLMAWAFAANNLWLYFFAMFLLQIPTNFALAAYSGIIPDVVPMNQRGAASGSMALLGIVGTMAGLFTSAQLVERNMHGVLFLTLGSVYSISCLFSAFGVRENRLRGPVPKLNLGRYIRSLWIDPKKYPDFAWVWITRALVMMGFYLITGATLQFYFQDVLGSQKPVADSTGLAILAFTIAAISGVIGGRFSDQHGRKPFVIVASIGIGATAIAFLLCRNLSQAYIVGAFFGLAYGIYTSVDWALGADVMPDKSSAAKDMAVWHIAQALPQQIASIVVSVVLSNFLGPMVELNGMDTQKYTLPAYIILFVSAAICFFLGGLLVRKVRGVA